MQVRACFAGRALARLEIGSCVGVGTSVELSQSRTARETEGTEREDEDKGTAPLGGQGRESE